MQKRPPYKSVLTPVDLIIESGILTIVVVTWFLVAISYGELPEVIPIHFDASGMVDGKAPRIGLLFLPMVSTGLYLLLTLLSKYPQSFNYAVKISHENANFQYANVVQMTRLIKLIISLIFLYAVYSIVNAVSEASSQITVWPVYLLLTLMLLTIIYFSMMSLKRR